MTKLLKQHYNDAVAVEMESAGVALASQLNQSLPMLAIRGISDRIDAKSRPDASALTAAATNAARFGVGLASAIIDATH